MMSCSTQSMLGVVAAALLMTACAPSESHLKHEAQATQAQNDAHSRGGAYRPPSTSAGERAAGGANTQGRPPAAAPSLTLGVARSGTSAHASRQTAHRYAGISPSCRKSTRGDAACGTLPKRHTKAADTGWRKLQLSRSPAQGPRGRDANDEIAPAASTPASFSPGLFK